MTAEIYRRNFRRYVEAAWPLVEPKPFVSNWHIDAICDHLAYLAIGDIRFLMINMPPRMTKSLVASVLFHTWMWTDEPQVQFLSASYAKPLAVRDAVQARRLMESSWYRERYGKEFFLLEDENAKEKYRNNKGGYRISLATATATTGEGGDIIIYDDPHNMADVNSEVKLNKALSWHDNSFRSRMNDPNNSKKVYIGQRSHATDVFGHVLEQEDHRWVVLSLPMEYDKKTHCVTYLNKGNGPDKKTGQIYEDPRKIQGELLCPKRFNRDTAKAEKKSMAGKDWDAQYQQNPLASGGIILKRQWWKQWVWPEWHPFFGKQDRELPEFFEVIQSYDTAFEEEEQDDYNVRTTWGLFMYQDIKPDKHGNPVKSGEERVCALMLERFKERCDFPTLRVNAIKAYRAYRPSKILVEKKASGHSLVQELRKKKLPVRAVPIENKDKISRAHMGALPLEKGCIWYVPRDWAFDVMNECAKFPQVQHDDQVDSCVMAWRYMRMYMDLEFDDDEKEIRLFRDQPKKGYR